jgi:hypothetical protein
MVRKRSHSKGFGNHMIREKIKREAIWVSKKRIKKVHSNTNYFITTYPTNIPPPNFLSPLLLYLHGQSLLPERLSDLQEALR